MNMPIDIPHELYEDEIVTFLADRYRTSADNIVRWFLVQDGLIEEMTKEIVDQIFNATVANW